MKINLTKDSERIADLQIGGKKSDTAYKYLGIKDQIIWDDFKSGEESAFIHIYSTYFYELISFGYQFCHEKQLVEDCVQDLFVDLRRRRKNYSPIKTSIRLYLFQAVKRRIIDYQKKIKKTTYVDGLEKTCFEIVLPHETFIINEQVYSEKIERLNGALKKLSTRQREALYYLYFKCMSYEEIKVLMGLDNIKSARNLIYKAIAVLKPYLETVTAIFLLLLQ